MHRNNVCVFRNLLLLIAVTAPLLSAQPSSAGQAPEAESTSGGKGTSSKSSTLSKAQKIALAMSAAPVNIAKDAAIAEMAEMSGEAHKELRSGTNGWVCYVIINQPMCLDREWQKWVAAWMSKSEPKIEGTGIAYMLKGDNGASNTDPYATGPTADNQWVISPAHLMLLFPDPKMLDSYSTDPKNGGPWVMWKGTPYAHVMVPVAATKSAVMKAQ
jgi:hypothetical protein